MFYSEVRFLNFKGKTQESIPHKESFSEMKRDEATVSNQNQQNLSSSLPGETTTMKISDVLKKLDCLYLLDAFEERDVRTVLDLENVLMDKLPLELPNYWNMLQIFSLNPHSLRFQIDRN